jgi:glycosyltransferase involved in cell wall biosynthesis
MNEKLFSGETVSPETILVSAIIPAYNAARFLPAAIENIRAQNVANLEIIVVDDGSSDNCEDVARSLGARYFRQENSGPAAARNAGLELSRGELIAFLDADDLWPEGSLQARLDCLQKNPQLEIALGKVQCLRDVPQAGSTPDATEDNRETKTELSEPFVSFNIGAALYRKSVFEKIGGFDADLRFGEDTDWFMRAREASVSLLVLPETTLHYRLHEGGMTSGKSAAQLNVARVLKKSLDRRRQMQNANTKSAPASLPNLQAQKSEPEQNQ